MTINIGLLIFISYPQRDLQMKAHYFKQGKSHVLILSADSRPVGERIVLDSKKAVRDMAKQRGAEPHNF